MSIRLNTATSQEIAKASLVASYLWEREWAERNGGNISINLTDIFGELPGSLSDFCFLSCENFPEEASGLVFFVTGTGERLRNLSDPSKAGCIVKFSHDASGYHILWGGRDMPDYRPTSEFLPHVKIHLDRLSDQSKHRAVVHTHPIELICITHHPELSRDEEKLNKAIWGMLPEVRVFLPKGLGITYYTLPGSIELANKTVRSLKTRDVVLWNKHGAIASGVDAMEAFDYIDVANKGAKIYLICLASGFQPEGLTDDEMQELADTL